MLLSIISILYSQSYYCLLVILMAKPKKKNKINKTDKIILKARKENKGVAWERVCPKCGSADVALKTFISGRWNCICKKCSHDFMEQKKKK